MNQRTLLPDGSQLKSSQRTYIIQKYISAGSNSIVYQAYYQDTLMPDLQHIVLIKELYPDDPQGRITRSQDGSLSVASDALNFFEYHKNSFLLGNQAHLMLNNDGSGRIAENLDSFEANHTLYTVLTSKKGEVLLSLQKQGIVFPTLTDTILFIQNLLKALLPFHEHGLLHLDISPDNLFLLSEEEEGKFPTEVLLLDFNSVYSMEGKLSGETQYYLGKPGFMAPEILLHQRKELGPWTDIYSVTVVWYELLTGEPFPKDRELKDFQEAVSPYSRLLLHEKERSAIVLNQILKKGLELQPKNRYQSAQEMLADVRKLKDLVDGRIREAYPLPGGIPNGDFYPGNSSGAGTPSDPKQPSAHGRRRRRRLKTLGTALCALGLLFAGGIGGGLLAPGITELLENNSQSMEHSKLNLTLFPLERDDSIVLTEKNIRHPLEDNIMKMQVQSSMSVRVSLKDFVHPGDTSAVFETYGIFPIYNGREDKRGWQFNDQTYSFFTTPDNRLHMELHFQDTNDFDLEYIGVIFANYNYTETNVLLDIKDCTLIDGEGNSYDMTELEGSHILFFDEENWQWNLLTDMNQDYVENFDDIYGGKLVVDAEAAFLEPFLEVSFESDQPEIASIDERGRIFAHRQGQATITVTVKDLETGDSKSTQMLVHVTSKLE